MQLAEVLVGEGIRTVDRFGAGGNARRQRIGEGDEFCLPGCLWIVHAVS